MKSWSWQYLPLSTRASKHVGDSRIRQLSLARSASLKHWISRNPKPPSFFDLVIVFEAIHDIFFSPVLESHQKRVNTDWILLHRDNGSLKHCIAWLGMGDSTLFNNVIFPAEDRNRFFHPFARCLILSTIKEKRSFFLIDWLMY